jgi:tetratricopeptide (TPR) repeat protein
MESTLTLLKAEAFRHAFHRFKSSPKVLEKSIVEVENAFSQLSQIKRILTIGAESNEPHKDLLSLARQQFKDKRFKDAMETSKLLIQEGGHSEEALLLCGTSALYSGDLENAGKYADEVLRRDSHNPNGLVLKALSLKEIAPLEALELLDRAAKIRPNSPVIKEYRARILLVLDQNPKQNPKATFARKWLRARLHRDLKVTYLGSPSEIYETLSLSAGGCLVAANDLPRQFPFALELKDFGRIRGIGEVSYIQGKNTGIRFVDLNSRDQSKIDSEVKHLPLKR